MLESGLGDAGVGESAVYQVCGASGGGAAYVDLCWWRMHRYGKPTELVRADWAQLTLYGGGLVG